MNKSNLQNLKNLNPCILENEERIVSKQDYKIKKVCFTENTGKVIFKEPNGIFIVRAVIFSDTYCKTVTKKVKQHVGQKEDFLKRICINTMIFNKFTRGNIECSGKGKRLIIEYITDNNMSEEKHIVYTEIEEEYHSRKINNFTKNCEEIETPFEKKHDSSIYLINKEECSNSSK